MSTICSRRLLPKALHMEHVERLCCVINSGCFLVVIASIGLEAKWPRSVGSVFQLIEKMVISSRSVGSFSGSLAWSIDHTIVRSNVNHLNTSIEGVAPRCCNWKKWIVNLIHSLILVISTYIVSVWSPSAFDFYYAIYLVHSWHQWEVAIRIPIALWGFQLLAFPELSKS